MKNQKVILKYDSVCEREQYKLGRIEGTVTADSIIKLIDIADLSANPREAKIGEITEDIIDSLSLDDGLFHFKTKGLLLATGECRPLERKRYQLHFQDSDIEGILDGGHNTLAIALYILREAIGEEHPDIKKIKRWEDLHEVWVEHRQEIAAVQDCFSFLTPVEVVFPRADKDGLDTFQNAILDIAQARNNNAELTAETKANKAGYYTALRVALEKEIADQVEWKTNDGGRIKARDLVALAWIPLSMLPDNVLNGAKVSPKQIYSSKGACTNAFNELMARDDVTQRTKGDIRELTHEGIRSALTIMRDLPRLYDMIYTNFPDAYNDVSPGFGRISSVRVYDPGKKGESRKYLRSAPRTKFYRSECKFDYPDGFIMPLVYGLRAMLEYKNGKLSWKTDPAEFIEKHLTDVVPHIYSMIEMAKYDPQKVGKADASYRLAESAFKFLL